jgi:hypothetical protein
VSQDLVPGCAGLPRIVQPQHQQEDPPENEYTLLIFRASNILTKFK